MRFRKLRIAFSATCLIACALLIVLWVRSYWWRDMIDARHPHFGSAYIASLQGKLRISVFREHRQRRDDFGRWGVNSAPADRMAADLERSPMPKRERALGFEIVNYWNPFAFAIPFWFLVPLVGTIAVAPWLRLRFRLRTLLIAMTLVAVVLGLIVWLSR
jgi:hypothetical protein